MVEQQQLAIWDQMVSPIKKAREHIPTSKKNKGVFFSFMQMKNRVLEKWQTFHTPVNIGPVLEIEAWIEMSLQGQ